MSTPESIIGIVGKAGSGKSLAGSYLFERHQNVLLKFATPIKNMLGALGLTYREIEGDLKDKPCVLLNGRTPRYALQTLGTEWGRRLMGEEMWVRHWRRRLPGLRRVVCDDVRFPNEVEEIRSLGGIIVRIDRKDPRRDDHPSEYLEDLAYDYRFSNVGTREDLFGAMEGLMGSL